MNYLRTILARFARLLLRLARAIDSSVLASPGMTNPQQMALLRMRYPGAPAHWLEVVANRTLIAEADASPPPQPRLDHSVPEEMAPTDLQHVSPTFPQENAGPKSVARFTALPKKEGAARPGRRLAAPLRHSRPQLIFAERQVRPATADLSRIIPLARRDPGVRFLAARPHHAAGRHGATVDHEHLRLHCHESQFPHTGERDALRDCASERSEVESSPATRVRTDPQFINAAEPPGRIDTMWPDEPRDVACRPTPRFPEPRNHWPELPSLAEDDSGDRLPPADEAALLSEQMVGTWSA